MIIGIVGSEAIKFTPETEAKARAAIRDLLDKPEVTGMASGHCHLGGIDIWAEEIAEEVRCPALIYPPRSLQWSTGYKPRNIQIAEASDVVYCITVAKYPEKYDGMKFRFCYHCRTDGHVKSGGCWTVKYAKTLGKGGVVISIEADGQDQS